MGCIEHSNYQKKGKTCGKVVTVLCACNVTNGLCLVVLGQRDEDSSSPTLTPLLPPALPLALSSTPLVASSTKSLTVVPASSTVTTAQVCSTPRKGCHLLPTRTFRNNYVLSKFYLNYSMCDLSKQQQYSLHLQHDLDAFVLFMMTSYVASRMAALSSKCPMLRVFVPIVR